MLKSSIWLSILTAFFGADVSWSKGVSPEDSKRSSVQSHVGHTSHISEIELTESQKINEEARRNVGRELLDL